MYSNQTIAAPNDRFALPSWCAALTRRAPRSHLGARSPELFRHLPGLLPDDERRRWLNGIYAARAAWTPCFEDVQFTLGRAYYTHLEEGREAEYFADALASDQAVERAVPRLQARVRALATELVRAPVTPRRGWCGPGVHIFPAGEWLSQHGGDVHFDTEGLRAHELAARAPALSLVLMLQPPERGGGLRLWDARYEGDDTPPAVADLPSVDIDYGPGDLLVFDSYRLHQILPFAGDRDRVSVTAHLVLGPLGWEAWF
jgi:hypothetical protein